MRGKRRIYMDVSIVIVTFCMLLGNTVAFKSVYNMDSALDCGYIASQTIGRDQSVTVNAKTTDTFSSSQTGCTIYFRTADTDATLKVDFESFIINSYDVELYLSGDGSGSMTSYGYGDNPSTYFTIGRSLTLTLHRTNLKANQYGFQLKVTAVGDTTAEFRTITVSSSNCGGTYTISDQESLYLNYYGSDISECRFTVNHYDSMDEICASPEKFDVDDCDTKLEYHKGFYSSLSADDTYGCVKTQWSDYCTTLGTLVVVFKNTGYRSNSDTIKLKISSRDNAIVSAVVTSVYVVVGIIIGVIVLVVIITVVVICVCCRRRRSQAGTVYRAQQPAVVTTTTGYPMQTQAGYQPVQHVYQPPAPQTGNQQPPPQMGYQQPPPQMGYPPLGGYQPAQQAGYPPAPQQGWAGYQTGADPNPDVKASDLPMQPPPYPGN